MRNHTATNRIPNFACLAALTAGLTFTALHPVPATAAEVWQDAFPRSVEALAWSPDGTTIAVGGAGANPNVPIELHDAATGALLGTLPSRPLGTFSLDYSPNGDYLAAGGAFISQPDVPIGANDVFDTATGAAIASYSGSKVAFAADANRLASAGFGITRGVWVHGVPSGANLFAGLASQTYTAVAISPDGETVALGTNNGEVRIIHVPTGQVVATLNYVNSGTATVREIAYSPDGTMLAAAGSSFDGFVAAKVWRTSNHSLLHTLSPNVRGFGDIAFTPDSATVVAAATAQNFSREIHFWNAVDGQLLHTLEADGLIDAMAFSPNGAQLVYGQTDGKVVVVCNPLRETRFDLDEDCDVDADDYALVAECVDGPAQPTAPGCARMDFDADGDADLLDLATFQAGFGAR